MAADSCIGPLSVSTVYKAANAASIVAGGVATTFSMQAVLRASGIGREHPAADLLLSPAAGLILKDALGQCAAVGGMYFVPTGSMDRHFWAWRMAAAVLETAGMVCDSVTPFHGPSGFIGLAAVSSLCKAVACTAAASSKAVCCQQLAGHAGVGTLTAELASQTTMAYMLGTVVSFFIALADGEDETDALGGRRDARTVGLVTLTSVIQVFTVWIGLKAVERHEESTATAFGIRAKTT